MYFLPVVLRQHNSLSILFILNLPGIQLIRCCWYQRNHPVRTPYNLWLLLGWRESFVVGHEVGYSGGWPLAQLDPGPVLVIRFLDFNVDIVRILAAARRFWFSWLTPTYKKCCLKLLNHFKLLPVIKVDHLKLREGEGTMKM